MLAPLVASVKAPASYMSPRVNESGAGESNDGIAFKRSAARDSSNKAASDAASFSRQVGACSAMACSTGTYSSPAHRDHGLSAAASTGI